MSSHPFAASQPANIAWSDSGEVAITWQDAEVSTFSLAYLREQCPCATCKGTHGEPTTLVRQSRGGLPILQNNPKKSPSVEVKSVAPVGNYAIRFTWGDGHNDGLYSWRYLRDLHDEHVRNAQVNS